MDNLSSGILYSKKYKHICSSVILRLMEENQNKYKSSKAVIKAVKSDLHRIFGSYTKPVNYKRIFSRFKSDLNYGFDLKSACIKILKLHSSTNERISFLSDFYAKIFDITGIPGSVLDLACGLNPVSIPWMNLPDQCSYFAYDIDESQMNFINSFFSMANINGSAFVQDIVAKIPDIKADTAFLLKSVPVLEFQKKGIVNKIVNDLNVKNIVVSFPLKSLGKKDKGMMKTYTDFFMLNFKNYDCKKLLFPNELVFVIQR